jgi:hypothetical protein
MAKHFFADSHAYLIMRIIFTPDHLAYYGFFTKGMKAWDDAGRLMQSWASHPTGANFMAIPSENLSTDAGRESIVGEMIIRKPNIIIGDKSRN